MKKVCTLILAALLLLIPLSGCSNFADEKADTSNTHRPPTSYPDVMQDYDNETESDGGEFFGKDRKYTYDGSDLTILYLENRMEQNYSVTIHGEYLDADGKVIQKETQTFDGFPAYWQNYFVFLPNITYDKFKYTLEYEIFEGECPISADLKAYTLELTETKQVIYERFEQLKDTDRYPTIVCNFVFENPPQIPLSAYVIVFDDLGEIYFLEPYVLHPTQEKRILLTKLILQTTEDKITWSNELTDSVGGIVSITPGNIFSEK